MGKSFVKEKKCVGSIFHEVPREVGRTGETDES